MKKRKPLRSIHDVDDDDYEDHVLRSFKKSNGFFNLTLDDSMGFGGCPADPRVHPKPGSVIRLYGKGFGYVVRGCAIDGKVIFYRTQKQQEAINRRQLAKVEREQKKAKEEFKASGTMKKPRAKFTIKPGKEKAYDDWRAKNDDPYSGTCFLFAERWAELMEAKTAGKPEDVASVAEACSKEADAEFGITGFMYGMAVNILSEAWILGEALRRWHNSLYGESGKSANEKGGVVNPAILTISPKES